MTPGSYCWLKLLIAVTASLYAGGVSGCKPDSATQSESTRTGTEPIQNTGRLTNTVAESDWRTIKEKNEQLAAENRLLRRMLVEAEDVSTFLSKVAGLISLRATRRSERALRQSVNN